MPPPIQLYIATSLDGYIARPDGSIDWLERLPNPDQLDYGYADFYAGIDTVLMGRITYETVLGFDVDWPYGDCQTFVLTRRQDYAPQTERTHIIHELEENVLRGIQDQSDKGIWAVGGGHLVSSLLDLSALDTLIITLIPVVLGQGIPLFPDRPPETWFELEWARSFPTGVVMLTYRRRSASNP